MKYIFSFVILLSFSESQQIRLGLLESEIYNNINPYYSFNYENTIVKKNLFGNGLYYYENQRLKTDDVLRVEYSDNTVTIYLKSDSQIKVKDVEFTFQHYRRYFEKYKNYKYYFFSKIKNIRSNNNIITFNLSSKGLFNLHHLTFPILRTFSASSFISKDKFFNGFDYYGYGDYVISNNDNEFLLKAKSSDILSKNDLKLNIYNNINLLQTDIINNKVDFYNSNYFSKFIYENQFILNNYRKRYINKLNNNLFVFGFNSEKFSIEERNLFSKIIDRDKIVSNFISFQGKVANSLFPAGSSFFFSRNVESYKPLDALNGLTKLGYKIQDKVFKKDLQKDAIRLYYPANNELFKLIADEIILNFHELRIDIQGIAVEPEELKIRIQKNRYDLYLQNMNYSDNDYISFFQYLVNNNFINTDNIIRNIDRLESIDELKNYLPLVQRIQLQIEEYQDFFPLFFLTHEQILINKKINDYLKSYTHKELRYFEINPLSKWTFSSE